MQTTYTDVTIRDSLAARARIGPYTRHTPLEHSHELSRHAGADVHLKLENVQVTGSFKVRGPLNKLLQMTGEERARGVAAATAGNHGIGVAYAAMRLGAPARIFLPGSADLSKVAALEAYGARLERFADFKESQEAAIRAAASEGMTFLSAYSDPAVIAANGVIGLELLDDLPDVGVALVGIGGGGLVSGIGTVLKAANPEIEVWGVETANSPTFSTWRERGQGLPVEMLPSIAEGLSGYIEPETLTWPIVRRVVDRMLTISEEELVGAVTWMLEHHRLVLEPSGAATVAALLRAPGELAGKKVAAIVSGRNISMPRLMGMLGYEKRR